MAHEPTRPSSRPPDQSPSDRLDSWKDVAVYLHRDVSTVQRWEKREGMPVHRHVHEKQGTVYAFRSELDAWWRGRGASVGHQEGEELDPTESTCSADGPGGTGPTATGKRRAFRLRWTTVVGRPARHGRRRGCARRARRDRVRTGLTGKRQGQRVSISEEFPIRCPAESRRSTRGRVNGARSTPNRATCCSERDT